MLALGAFLLVFLLGNTFGGGGTSSGTDVVVIANSAIPIRHQITGNDLSTEKVSSNVTQVNNTFSSPSQVQNLIAQINITKGSVITSDMLAKDIGLVPPGLAGATLPLASGYVAYTIPTGEQQGVAGHITVGDYITVIASAPVSVFTTAVQIGTPKVVSKTIFTNIRVIGVGPAIVNVQPAGSGASNVGQAVTSSGGVSSSLTIELTQCDAEYFTWFLNNTTLKYTLESSADYLKQPPSTPDPTCPTVLAAQGISQKAVDDRYHFTSL